MENSSTSADQPRTTWLYRIAPGLGQLAAYQRDWFRHDLIAGVSVAAVALPTAIAYAQLIGLEPVTGLYAAIPAMLAYALFGTSRHLIVNPDTATCAMIGAALSPLAVGDADTPLPLARVRPAVPAAVLRRRVGSGPSELLQCDGGRAEFSVDVVTMLGVIALDVLQGILLAVAVALLLLLKRSTRPPDAVAGRLPVI